MKSDEFKIGDEVEVFGYAKGTRARDWNGPGVVTDLTTFSVIVTLNHKAKSGKSGGFAPVYVYHTLGMDGVRVLK